MRFIRQLSNREKIILSFLVLLVVLNGLTIVVSRNLSGISLSFKSMLEDRLIPSSYLLQIQEGVYKNRLFLEEMIYLSGQAEKELIRKIEENNTLIDQLNEKFAQTYLTIEEAESLEHLNEQVEDYRKLEQQIISLIEKGDMERAQAIYLKQSLAAFEHLLLPVHDLENIQLEVGVNLYEQAEHTASILQMMTYFSLGIALMITVYMLKVLHFKVK